MSDPQRSGVIDDQALNRLIEQSQDLHTDAMSVARQTLPDLRDLASDRKRISEPSNTAAVAELAIVRQNVG